MYCCMHGGDYRLYATSVFEVGDPELPRGAALRCVIACTCHAWMHHAIWRWQPLSPMNVPCDYRYICYKYPRMYCCMHGGDHRLYATTRILHVSHASTWRWRPLKDVRMYAFCLKCDLLNSAKTIIAMRIDFSFSISLHICYIYIIYIFIPLYLMLKSGGGQRRVPVCTRSKNVHFLI